MLGHFGKQLLFAALILHQCIFIATGSKAGVSETNFVKNTDYGLAPNGQNFNGLSKLDCARKCSRDTSSCRAFAFDKLTRQCSFGTIATAGTVFTTSDVEVFSIPAQPTECPPGEFSPYTLDGKTIYLLVNRTNADYEAARNQCECIGGRLFPVKTQEAIDLLAGTILVNDPGYYFWIGLDDIVDEGVYIYSDGTTLTQGQMDTLFYNPPDNYYDEDCIIYQDYGPDYGGGYLNDVGCTFYTVPSVCERL